MSDNMGWGPYGAAPGTPGWGGWAPPPLPKPGVIPLGPLALGDIFNGAFATIGRYWKQLLGTAFAVYGAAVLVVLAAIAVAYSAVNDEFRALVNTSAGSDPAWDQFAPLLAAFFCVWLIAMVSMLLASAMLQAAVPVILQDAVLGRPTTFGAVFRRAAPRTPAVLGVAFLSGLIVLVPVALAMLAVVASILAFAPQDDVAGAGWLALLGFLGALATIPLAIWLWVRFTFAPAVAVFENQGPVQALRRSSELVRGDWWRVLGISLLGQAMAAAVNMLLQQLVNVAGMFQGTFATSGAGQEDDVTEALVSIAGFMIFAMVVSLIGQIIVSIVPPLVNGLLYVDERLRKENLAPALAEAAGTPLTPEPPMPAGPYGPSGPPAPDGPPFSP
ncbi:hypothetical protein ACFU5O_27450 [Streptomyces sp. NPDC057445]|uniref:DUF7847 domain-containing protein n=1 Tax=Streptomyces sp. NPDC057445 TaxID=3346136 RepID=UPI0036C0A941